MIYIGECHHHILPPMGLANFKIEYHKLCEVAELADKVLGPILLVFVSVYIPLFCFSFYNVARGHDEDLQRFFCSICAGSCAGSFW